MSEDKKLYEVSFLAKSENGAATMAGHLTRFGAEITDEGSLRKVELAYPINKQLSAYFGSINCKLPADSVSKVNESVKLDEEVMRILIVEPQSEKEKQPQGFDERTEAERGTPSGKRSPKKDTPTERAVSNELLEEKLEEILQ
jgi:ribosomal protein S6